MTPGRWSEVKTVLSGVLEADPTERPVILDRLCGAEINSLASLFAKVMSSKPSKNFMIWGFSIG